MFTEEVPVCLFLLKYLRTCANLNEVTCKQSFIKVLINVLKLINYSCGKQPINNDYSGQVHES